MSNESLPILVSVYSRVARERMGTVLLIRLHPLNVVQLALLVRVVGTPLMANHGASEQRRRRG